jgi:hypothetical protein
MIKNLNTHNKFLKLKIKTNLNIHKLTYTKMNLFKIALINKTLKLVKHKIKNIVLLVFKMKTKQMY